MITAITFQFSYNHKYINPSKKIQDFYGEKTTEDLQYFLEEDIALLNAIHNLITDLNLNLNTPNVPELIAHHLGGHIPNIRHITKTKRTYSIAGLTIHEEDK